MLSNFVCGIKKVAGSAALSDVWAPRFCWAIVAAWNKRTVVCLQALSRRSISRLLATYQTLHKPPF